jgi:hypothetical protein
VPDYAKVVPQVIQECGASFVRLEPLMEGAERALFDVGAAQSAEVVACIKKHVPQGNVEAPSQDANP